MCMCTCWLLYSMYNCVTTLGMHMCVLVCICISIACCQPTPQVQPHHRENPVVCPHWVEGWGSYHPPGRMPEQARPERDREGAYTQRGWRLVNTSVPDWQSHNWIVILNTRHWTHRVWFHNKSLIDTKLVIRGAPQKVHYLWPRVSVPLISRPAVTTWWGGTTPFSKESSSQLCITIVILHWVSTYCAYT